MAHVHVLAGPAPDVVSAEDRLAVAELIRASGRVTAPPPRTRPSAHIIIVSAPNPKEPTRETKRVR
ncbi:hypothetical protein ACIGNX_01365 [Actinosynnema sp. NPDC053489]|uniref:hypothetical protein n=1 Tax=Actinosynnema sp. NPDC053489 TaxID=3363916 RepID=UPI0037C5D250